MRAKKTKKTAVQLRKRSLKEEAVNQPRRRLCTSTSRGRTTVNSHASSSKLDHVIVEHSTTTILEEEEVPSIIYGGRKSKVIIL